MLLQRITRLLTAGIVKFYQVRQVEDEKNRGQKRTKQKPVVLKGPRKVSVLFSFSVSFARSEDATGAMLCYQIQLLRN
jgi:hypothetical protein